MKPIPIKPIIKNTDFTPYKDSENISEPPKINSQKKIDSAYARYVLFVLVVVSILNFMDRSIIGVLVEDIKQDLNLSDTDIGFLGGTAFTVFYATFGIVLGRVADVWNRKKLITLGLGVWSLMTALSGLARSFLPLAACRFGVGAGEASASPAIYSMLYDYFSPKYRTRVIAIYLCGASIGGGLGIFLGGQILDSWNVTWPNAKAAPFGLKGWQAVFIIVGAPGIIVACWVATLREPARGQGDGILSQPHPNPLEEVSAILLSMLPIANLWLFSKSNTGRKVILTNLGSMVAIVFSAYALAAITGDYLQWAALGFAVYTAFSWSQSLALRDPVVFGMLFNCKALRYIILGDALIGFNLGVSFWIFPFFQRYYGISVAEISAVLGIGNMLVGITGVIVGGVLADYLRSRSGRGKLYVYILGVVLSTFSLFILVTSSKPVVAYAATLFATFTISMYIAPIMSTVNDLVLPRARATTMSFFLMVTLLSGTALGPYFVGYISDSLAITGVDVGESLRRGMLFGLVVPVLGVAFIIQAIRHIESDQQNVVTRGRGLGEEI